MNEYTDIELLDFEIWLDDYLSTLDDCEVYP